LSESLFSELKRRNVFKVGVAYLVLAWVVVQVTDTAVPALHLPEWILTAVFFFGVIGFPFAIFFAWAFEVTPDGVKRESEIDPDDSIRAHGGRTLDFIIIALLTIALGYFIVEKYFISQPQDSDTSISQEVKMPLKSDDIVKEEKQEPSIAVLPFVNMSSDAEQEFFSDGITEEILNALVRIKNLKVIARTSAFAYKGQNPDLRDVGKKLGVNYILEGSVRKSGQKLRVTAQLINSSDASHIWSNVYDRELTEIFAIQDEIASSIADSLTLSLGLQNGQTSTVDKISDMQAYDNYLRARSIIKSRKEDTLHVALDLLIDVVKSEPDYAPGWAALSLIYNVIPFYLSELDGKKIDYVALQYKSEHAARRAVFLNPSSASARHVLANALRWRHKWLDAEEQYKIALSLDPNSVEIIEDYGEFLTWVGKIEEAYHMAKKGLDLEKSSPFPYMRYLDALRSYKGPEIALEKSLEALLIFPNNSIVEFDLINSAISIPNYDLALEHLQSCHDCASVYSEINIKIIKSYLLGEDLNKYLLDDDILLAQFEVMHLVGGDELILKSLKKYLLNTPAFNYMSATYNAPVMDSVRTDERFKHIMVYLELVDYWRERGWPSFCTPISDYDFECGASDGAEIFLENR
jgi:TolB-like protein/tetratricopeptide (TPR) repeat protein